MTTDCSAPWPTPIRAINAGKCEIGGGTVDIMAPGVFVYTEGWVQNRVEGGGHGVTLPKRHLRWACGACMKKAVDGKLDQPGLFDG